VEEPAGVDVSEQELEDAKNNNMNIYEGHLGGYVMSGEDRAPSGLDIRNGDPATWYPDLWLWFMSSLNVRSVIDVGCAEGLCPFFFHNYGCVVRGVDGSRMAKSNSRIPEFHDVHDFESGPYVPPSSYDLVWCCEFVEHVEEHFADNFMETFKSSQRFIALCHGVPGQPGWHHVNCQWAEYWIERVEAIGYRYRPVLTRYAREVAQTGHFANRGLVFERER
jgi:hypothetical protein